MKHNEAQHELARGQRHHSDRAWSVLAHVLVRNAWLAPGSRYANYWIRRGVAHEVTVDGERRVMAVPRKAMTFDQWLARHSENIDPEDDERVETTDRDIANLMREAWDAARESR